MSGVKISSLFSKGGARSPEAQAPPPDDPSPPPAAPSVQPPPSGDTDEELFSAMDRAVFGFLRILESEERDENGNLIYTLQERLKCFEKAESWIARRHKLAPPSTDDAPGIEMMRRTIKEEADRLFKERGVVMLPPKRKNGRPTRAEMAAKRIAEVAIADEMLARGENAHRKLLMETPADDAGLNALLATARGESPQ